MAITATTQGGHRRATTPGVGKSRDGTDSGGSGSALPVPHWAHHSQPRKAAMTRQARAVRRRHQPHHAAAAQATRCCAPMPSCH
jgi:hypothetical protein